MQRMLFFSMICILGVFFGIDSYCAASAARQFPRHDDSDDEVAGILGEPKQDMSPRVKCVLTAEYILGVDAPLMQRSIAGRLAINLDSYKDLIRIASGVRRPVVDHGIAFDILGAYKAGIDFENDPLIAPRLIKACTQAPLVHAVIKWTDPACIVALLQVFKEKDAASAVARVADEHGQLPIHVAASFGYKAVVQELLHHRFNTDVETRDSEGRTPLLCAAYNWPRVDLYADHLGVVKLLLDREADIRAADRHHQTALHKVVLANQDEFCPQCADMITVLMAKDAQESAKVEREALKPSIFIATDKNGLNALAIACDKKWFAPVISQLMQNLFAQNDTRRKG